MEGLGTERLGMGIEKRAVFMLFVLFPSLVSPSPFSNPLKKRNPPFSPKTPNRTYLSPSQHHLPAMYLAHPPSLSLAIALQRKLAHLRLLDIGICGVAGVLPALRGGTFGDGNHGWDRGYERDEKNHFGKVGWERGRGRGRVGKEVERRVEGRVESGNRGRLYNHSVGLHVDVINR